MAIATNALAAAVGAAVNNQQFQSLASVLQRKILVIGTALPANTGFTNYTPTLCLSPAQAGATYGFGSMIHKMVQAIFAGFNLQGGQVPVYVSADSETNIGTATAATGTFAITGPATAAGTLSLYVDGVGYPVAVANAATATTVGTAVAAAINADPNCPVTASNGTGTVTVTAKSKGVWGNQIPLSINLGATDATPAGLAVVITQTGGVIAGSGTNTTSINATLAALGASGSDNANAANFTDLVCGHHQDQDVITAIGTYGGLGNAAGGLYASTIHRPFRCLWGDIVAGSTGLTNLQTLATTNVNDRTNGVIAAPGEQVHPEEIAANAIGQMAVINNLRAEQMYVGVILQGATSQVAAAAGNRWTDTYATRNTAVTTGVGTTQVVGGALTLQNVITFYNPSSVPATSNGYREMRNISVLQNILYNVALNFQQTKWQGTTIVKNTSAVTNPVSRAKARSLDDVRDDWVALVNSFYANAWIYSTDMPIAALSPSAATPAITVRPAGDGFISSVPMILSGIGNVLDNTVNFDIAIPLGS